MRKIAILPSLITLGNLACGFAAIAVLVDPEQRLTIFGGGVLAAAWFILLGMAFDLMDGRVARMTKASSDFGGQLDSLSDCVTFGIAPGMLIVAMSSLPYRGLVWLFAGLYVVCAVLRLARFNISCSDFSHEEDYFKGLPSPAAAGLVASMVIFDEYTAPLMGSNLGTLHAGITIPFVGLAAGLLMVSRIRYPHLMGWIFKGKKQFNDLVRLVVVCACIIWKPRFAFVVLFSAYAVSGIVVTARILAAGRSRRPRSEQEASAVNEPTPADVDSPPAPMI